MALYNSKISHYQDGYSLRQRIENDVREYMSPNQLFQTQANLDLQCMPGRKITGTTSTPLQLTKT